MVVGPEVGDLPELAVAMLAPHSTQASFHAWVGVMATLTRLPMTEHTLQRIGSRKPQGLRVCSLA